MNEQAEIPQSSINKKTQQTEQQDASQTELKPSKYLALLVALFPHCLITPRNFASQSKILTREPRILDQIDCRAKASACRNKPAAPGIKNPSFLAVKKNSTKSSSSRPLLVTGRNECPASAPLQQHSLAP